MKKLIGSSIWATAALFLGLGGIAPSQAFAGDSSSWPWVSTCEQGGVLPCTGDSLNITLIIAIAMAGGCLFAIAMLWRQRSN